MQLENKWSYGNCRAFHAACFGILWLLIQCISGLKKLTRLTHCELVQRADMLTKQVLSKTYYHDIS